MGIETTSSAYALDVYGKINVDFGSFVLGNTGSVNRLQYGTGYFQFVSSSNSAVMYIGGGSNTNVGIGTGTMSSSNKLEVNGAASIGYPDTYGGSAGGLIVSGNVGIGTTNPGALSRLATTFLR